MSKIKGIDVSYFQGNINFMQTAKDIQFVIIREGYRKTVDKKFFEYVKGFQAAGVPIHGVYHFVYAMTDADAKAEAQSCIANVERAGLPKSTYIWVDIEYDTIDKAKKQGVTYTNAMINQFTVTFCEAVKAAGYRTGIYTNGDYYKNHYTQDTLKRYPLWLADYSGEPDYKCVYQQYTDDGPVSGISGTVDMDYYYPENDDTNVDENTKADINTEKPVIYVTVEDALNLLRSWIGRNEYDGTHKYIIDIYNSYKPWARGYKVQYNDQWCDTTISALFIALNAVDLIGGTECGVEEHVKLFKKAGIWIEDGTVTPKPGDIIVFNWGDTTQPNDGYADHIGMVESVSGGMITTIEGNYKDSVARRKIAVGNGYIRGYARPKYGTSIVTDQPSSPVENSKPVNNAPIVPTVSGSTSTVRYGSTGSSVKTLQMALQALGYTIDVDGEFGRNTRTTVMLFQSKYAELENDGIVGSMTWKKIYALLTESIKTLNKTPVYVGAVTASSLNVRCYTSSLFDKVSAYQQLGKDNKVDVCAEVTNPVGEKWLYIRIAGSIFGFVSAEYIKKVK